MAPISNVQPFSYRDGLSYLEVLEGMRTWLNVTLLPAIQSMVTDLGAEWADEYNQLVELVNTSSDTINALVVEAQASETAAAQSAANAAASAAQAGVQQDTAITALFNNLTSAFRTATDLAYASKATQTTVESGRLSVASLLLKADKTYVDTGDSTNAAATTAVSGRVTTLETLTTAGRLAQANLDLRYLLKPPTPHAVFIGSSNSTPGEWVENFAADQGFVQHNYSVGGGGFTASSTGQFLAQINAAIADSTYDHSLVKYVFICDMGNDIRATNSISSSAPAVFAAARTAYPNARLILVPCFWGNATDNNLAQRIASISARVQEATDAGLPFNLEIVPYSWTWMGDTGAWMKPGEVHYTADGYERVRRFMNKFMVGDSTRYDVGFDKFIAPSTNVWPDSAYWRAGRIGDIVTLQNLFSVKTDIPIDTDLGQLDYGTWPMDTTYHSVINIDNRTVYSIAIFNGESGGGTAGGKIRTLAAMNAGNYALNINYRAY
jgi:hypothetical protein